MLRTCCSCAAFFGIIFLAGTLAEEGKEISKAPKSRTFFFTYQASVEGLEAGKVARIWVPVPPSNEDQEVTIISKELPSNESLGREDQYGNQIMYLEAKAKGDSAVALQITYKVKRQEVKMDLNKRPDDMEKIARFLQPDARVPIEGKPLNLIKGKELPMDQMALGKMLYDLVNNHMKYSKEGIGWGQGDAVWACDSKYGNCSDFHSLFISLARSQKIPSKFEIGFPLPEARGRGEIPGYHCWAKFRPTGKDWIPVDISEANKNPKMKDYYFGNLTEDRITFSTGRDIELVPKQSGDPLNFIVYPYVEVDGKPWPAEKIRRKFSYEDSNK
jgi:hypothetical protein